MSCLHDIPFWWSAHRCSQYMFANFHVRLPPVLGFLALVILKIELSTSHLLLVSTPPLIHTGTLRPRIKYHQPTDSPASSESQLNPPLYLSWTLQPTVFPNTPTTLESAPFIRQSSSALEQLVNFQVCMSWSLTLKILRNKTFHRMQKFSTQNTINSMVEWTVSLLCSPFCTWRAATSTWYSSPSCSP